MPFRPTPLAVAGAILSLAIALLCFAAPAGAVTISVGGTQFGVQQETAAPLTEISEPLSYSNGPVVHSSASYALYWDNHTGRYTGEWERLISGFLFDAGSASGVLSNNFAVITQYHDTAGAKAAYEQTFAGAYTDPDPYPASGNCSEGTPCLTDAQIRTELTKYITEMGLPTGLNPSSAPTPIYYVFTPPGVNVCLEGSGAHGHCARPASANPLCSYHAFIPAGGQLSSTVLYAVEPWTAGNLGTNGSPQVSGSNCQDGTGTLQEPNQIGLGPEGEYGTGLADLIINNVTDQALSTATNPLFTGWHDAGVDAKEVVDKCRNDFLGGELSPPLPTPLEKTEAGNAHNQTIAGGRYYLNDVYDQAAAFAPYPGVPCINGVHIFPKFTAPTPIRSGDVATFNATESDITLGVQKYNWSFGDGTGTEVNCGSRVPTNGFAPQECTGASGTGRTNPVASTQHVYTYGGAYTVSLTISDYGGNTATVSHEVTVSGPAPPAPPAPTPGTSTASTTSSPSTTTSGKTSGPLGTTGHAPPTATQAVVSRKLPSVLKNGLVIHYSVSEQVAGRFEVLLASSIARKLGIHGASATGLAKGTAPQTIIAKAILVTTKGGQSTYNLKLSKATAARLRKLPKVALMIRLVVHNAASPAVTTVLKTVNLSR
ncbi:MAG TPA: PKD domain-containing protein [Solirubrobacteraceae bacterium]|nr:PKD domain-containing protein [Solirubrobacteraceae bacterium]